MSLFGVGQKRNKGRWYVREIPDDLASVPVGQSVYVGGVTIWEQYSDKDTAVARANYLNRLPAEGHGE